MPEMTCLADGKNGACGWFNGWSMGDYIEFVYAAMLRAQRRSVGLRCHSLAHGGCGYESESVRPKQTGARQTDPDDRLHRRLCCFVCAASTSRTSSTRSGWTCNTRAGPTSSPCAHTHARMHACAALHIEQHAQPSGSVAVVVVVVARAGPACLTRSPSCWASRLRSRPPLLTRATLVTRSPWSSGTRKRAELRRASHPAARSPPFPASVAPQSTW